MPKLVLSLAVVLLLSLMSFAQGESKHPIDKALDTCVDKNGSTAGMVECTDKAYAAWDKELNKNYVELMRKLKPPQKEPLRLSQLEWIKHRDLEFRFLDSMFDTFQGTMYIPMRIGAHLDIVKSRALELKTHLEIYNDAAP